MLKQPDIDRGEMEHLRLALDKLDELEAIVDDGCYSEETERYIGRLRSKLEYNLASIERRLIEGLRPS